MEYLQSSLWGDYYRELDPDKRQAMFDDVTGQLEEDEQAELRRSLFIRRHTNPKDASAMVDNFLWQLVVMPSYYGTLNLFSKRYRGEILKIMDLLGVTAAAEGSDMEKAAVYWELRNTAERYLMTTRGSEYGRKFFGIMPSSDQEKRRRLAGDIWAMTKGVPVRYGLEKEMKLFTDAVLDAFFLSGDDAEDLLREAAEKAARKKF